MKKITKKEEKRRIQQLDEWLRDKDTLLDNWIQSLPKPYSQKLDFTEKSLIALGEYILSQYDDPDEVDNLKHKDEIFLISGYIGEVYIKTMPGDNRWMISDHPSRLPADRHEYHFWVGNTKLITFEPLGSFLPNLVYCKEPDKIFMGFKVKKISLLNRIKERSEVKEIKTVPGRGGSSYPHFVFSIDKFYTLKNIENKLESYCKKRSLKYSYFSDNHFLIQMADDYVFHFLMNNSKHIHEEMQEFVEDYKGDRDISTLKESESRIEFWGDQDPDGEYLNEYIFILEQLQKEQELLIFDHINGVFFDEV